MIETTPEQIVLAAQSEGWKKLNDVAKPADVAWEIHAVVEALQKTIKFYDKRRIALLEELAVKDEKDGNYKFRDDASESEFGKEHQRIWVFPLTLNIEKQGNEHIEAAELTVGEISAMRWMFEYDEVDIDDPFAEMS